VVEEQNKRAGLDSSSLLLFLWRESLSLSTRSVETYNGFSKSRMPLMMNTIEPSKTKRYPTSGWSMASGMVTTEAKSRGKRSMFAEAIPATPQSVSASTTPTVVKRSMIPHRRMNPTRMKKIARNLSPCRQYLGFFILHHI